MTRRRNLLGGAVAEWMILGGGLALFVSLFLTWSHQFSPAFLASYGASPALHGVPRDPTAWQVYSIMDVLLALLAGALGVFALVGRRGGAGARSAAPVVLLVSAVVALAFTVHALSSPPTNGASVFDAARNAYVPNSPAAGAGETVAIVGLGLAMAGLGLSLGRE